MTIHIPGEPARLTTTRIGEAGGAAAWVLVISGDPERVETLRNVAHAAIAEFIGKIEPKPCEGCGG